MNEDMHFYGKESRTLLLNGPIDEENASSLIDGLLALDRDSAEPITVHLNTGGGHTYQAHAVYDIMHSIRSPVRVVAMGHCMSSGLVVLAGADYRMCMPGTYFMYHQISWTSIELTSQMGSQDLASTYISYQDKWDELIRKSSSLSKPRWIKEFKGRDSKHFTAQEALAYGMIDIIVKPIRKLKKEKK